jgi:hypothetical protein
MIRTANQGTAANAGGARSFQVKQPWPGIAEFLRWALYKL